MFLLHEVAKLNELFNVYLYYILQEYYILLVNFQQKLIFTVQVESLPYPKSLILYLLLILMNL
jgi:hypothetical protein